MKIFAYFMFLFILILSSCGAPKSSTNAKFSLNFLNSDYDAGGLMVFGKNNDTNQYIGKNLSAGISEFELTNGNWSFIAIAWGNAIYKMEGTTKCDRVEGVELSGEDVNVNFILAADKCESNGVFGKKVSFESNFQVAPLSILNCSNLDAGIDPDPSDMTKKCFSGGASSMRVRIPEIDEGGRISMSNALTSNCYDFSSSPELTTAVKLPIFNDPSSPLQMVYEAYSGLGCTGNIISLNSKVHNNTALKYQPANQRSYVFAQVNYCQGIRNTQSVAANTTFSGHFVICSAAQFKEAFVGSNATFKYVLGKDIDFQGEEMIQHGLFVGAGGSLTGQNFTLSNFSLNHSGPLSKQALFSTVDGQIRDINISGVVANYDFSTAITNAGAILVGQSLGSANFDKIKMSNISLDIAIDVDVSSLGIFCGNCQSHTGINNVTIDGVKILLSGNSSPNISAVGILAGTFSGNLSGINILNSSISADSTFTSVSKVGGAIGHTTTTTYATDINVESISIKLASQAQSIGGLVGFGSELNNLIRTYVNASIDVMTGTTQPDIGGVIGKLTSGGGPNITSVNSKVSITGDAMPAGGVVGSDISTGSFYTYVSADTNLSGKGTCGGIVGNGSGVSSIKYARTRGVINCPQASVGGIIASAAALTLYSVHSKSSLINTSSAGSGGLIGQVSNATTISDSIFTGDTTFADKVNNGLLVGKMTTGTTTTITNTISTADNVFTPSPLSGYDIIGTGTVGTVVATNCYFMNAGSITSISSCSGYGTSAVLISDFETSSPNSLIWKTGTGVLPQLHSDLLQELFPNSAGARGKPYAISDAARWNAIAKVIDIDITSQFPASNFILTGTIDFNNNPALFNQWQAFRGSLRGNNQTIQNINYNSGLSGSGLIGVIHEGAKIFDNGNKLFINNVNFQSSNSGEPMGILASSMSLVAGQAEITDIVVKNSSVLNDSSSPAIGTGVIGNFSADNTSNIRLQRVKVIGSNIRSTTTNYVGGLIGNFASSITPTEHSLKNITIDSTTTIDGIGMSYVGGVFGSAMNLWAFGIISEATVKGDSFVGGITGYLSGGSNITTSLSSQQLTASGTGIGGIVGSCNSGGISNTYSDSTNNGTAIDLTGSGCSITSSFSVSSGKVYTPAGGVSASTLGEIQNNHAFFMLNLNDATYGFYYNFGEIPRLRLEEHLRGL